jgi:glycosyltransferase involved in cell wall biosynthesis
VLVINDGSKDDSMEKLIEAYQLEKIPYAIHQVIPTSEVLVVYKSKLPTFKNHTVIDKVNGEKQRH